ncbi:hypothetical protein Fcan01_27954 [Folsomia candida]|uniref:Uncharacterized protein n=1 Tax=Folsomia candida TaxID=158441 RepID=A0A226CV72_FOLCA|nr:hypothetical protein Fcan01_27954 [Folsomia candida]
MAFSDFIAADKQLPVQTLSPQLSPKPPPPLSPLFLPLCLKNSPAGATSLAFDFSLSADVGGNLAKMWEHLYFPSFTAPCASAEGGKSWPGKVVLGKVKCTKFYTADVFLGEIKILSDTLSNFAFQLQGRTHEGDYNDAVYMESQAFLMHEIMTDGMAFCSIV